MDAKVEVDTTVSNVIEPEASSDQNVEAFGTEIETLYINEKEVRNMEEQPAMPESEIVIVGEAVTPTTIEELAITDNVIYQVAENTPDIEQFVATECTTDGIVTYVTVAPVSTPETVPAALVEQITSKKEEEVEEVLHETYENVTQDNVIVQEENYELPRQSYEKFVQDAIEGELDEPVSTAVETSESVVEIIEQEKTQDDNVEEIDNVEETDGNVEEIDDNVEEIDDNVVEDPGTNESADSIEAKLQELTEGNVEQQHLEDGNEVHKEGVTMEVSEVADTENDLPVDEQVVLEEANVDETEEVIPVDYIQMEDHIEQKAIETPEVPVPEAVIINSPPSPQDNIEKQLSKIVHDEEPHQLSIAEEISRDFDDSDSDELTVSQQESHDNVMEEVVNIAKQLGHGPVTVTDPTGQVYYVESVEEVIVVENDSKMLNTKIGEEEIIEEERPAPPPIPSHLLGRNIDNPIEDTFRNGKTPPKPRLGVKIPYKHLTSQIVSKEDITKELLERSKSKVLQNRTSREQYFTNKLTRRLAKRLAPSTHQKREKVVQKDKEINNSDLIAILEGKDEEKPVDNKPQSDEKVVHMDKELEKALALKQLSELPRRGRRRKSSGYDVIENVNIPPRVRRSDIKVEAKDDVSVQQKDSPKVIVEQSNRNVVVETPNIEYDTMKMLKQTEIYKTTADLKKSNLEDKKTCADQKQPLVEVKKEIEKLHPQEEKSKLEIEKPDVEMVKSCMGTKKINVELKEPVLHSTTIEKERTKIDLPKTKASEPKVMVETSKMTIQKIEEITKGNLKESLSISSKRLEDIEKKPGNPPIKTYERKRKSTDDNVTPIPEKKLVTKITPTDVYVTKSSRIIKKKIIWDPDDPKTAKYAADKITPQRIIKVPSTIKVLVKEARKAESPSRQIKLDKIVLRSDKLGKPKFDSADKDTKSKSPDTTNKTKKRLSEVDRLLMDEGAVNMLYSVKNEDTKKFTGTIISLDKIQKELMNKTNEIKKELTSSTDKISPKSLRKKESPAATPTKKLHPASISRKKSKDSNRSSIHSPPPSPSPIIYANHADASRIIRRHSSSSYSSTEGDEVNEEHKDEKKPPKKRIKQETSQGTAANKHTLNDENLSKLEEENKFSNYNFDYSKFEQYKAINIGQFDNLIQISLLCEEAEKAYLTYEVLLELTDLLRELQADDTCKVVVLSSTASSFCHGINYKSLHIPDEQIRKEIAQKLAKAVTEYLKTLANFPKIIIAGVQGDCVGLAVTMLPLFDMVLASDTATFSIPNAKLGCAAEGGSLLSLPHLMHNALVSEMLYASRKFVAAEALRFGMVTRVIWPDKFQTELIAAVKEISTHSLQFKQITKRQLRNRMKQQIEESLTGEEDVLLETWISAECQKNFETYV